MISEDKQHPAPAPAHTRPGGCDICRRQAPLRRVIVKTPDGTGRVAYICANHPAEVRRAHAHD